MIEGVADGDALTSTTAATTTCRAGGSSLLDPADGERPRDALELGTRPVGEVLVPLARMSTVDHRVTPAQLEKAAAGAGYSRMPVLGPGSTIMGYLHIKDAIGVSEGQALPPHRPASRDPRPACRSTPRSTTPSPRCAPTAPISPLSPVTRAP